MLEIKQIPDGALFSVDFVGEGAAPETPEPHRHEYFEIFWILSGEGKQSIDFVEHEMRARRMFFITPGQVHDVHVLPGTLYAISFNAEFINLQQSSQLPMDKLFLQNRSDQPYVDLDELGDVHLRNVMAIIEQELDAHSPDKDMMSTLLVSFLRYVMRYLNTEVQSYSAKDSRMLKLLKLVDSHFIERKDTGFYSDKLAMTSKRLNELTKDQFSKTVTQLLHDKVIVEARRLLAFTNKTIKSIAFELGYQDTSYFCRFFKRLSGVSPQVFRENWHNKHVL